MEQAVLPSHHSLDDDDIDYIADTALGFFETAEARSASARTIRGSRGNPLVHDSRSVVTPERPKTSTRDLGEVMAELGHWLQLRLAMDEAPVLRMAGGPDKSGFSSDTVLFDLDDSDHRGRYVLRLPPPADAYPLFPWYDLERQVERDASGASTHVGPCPARCVVRARLEAPGCALLRDGTRRRGSRS